MPTYDYQVGSAAGVPAFACDRVVVVERYLDFAEIAAQRAKDGVAAIAAADVLKVIPIEAGTTVMGAGVRVLKAEGAAATIDLGDSAGAAQFLNDFDINALTPGLAAATTAKTYEADSYVQVLVNSATVDVAQILVWVMIADTRKVSTIGK